MRFGDAALGQGAAEDQIGSISLNFVDWDERRPADVILQEIRDDTAGLAGITVEVRKPQNGPQQGKPISIELTSRFPDLLATTVAEVRDALAGILLSSERLGRLQGVDDAIAAFDQSDRIKRIFAPLLIQNLLLTKRQEMHYMAELTQQEQVEIYLDTV